MRLLFITIIGFFSIAGAVQACPTISMAGVEQYNGTGSQLNRRADFNVVAGGENYVWNCSNVRPNTDTGAGYFTSQADFSFYLSGMGNKQLVISMRGNCDTALLINTGSASWYYDDDDNGNLQPRIVLTRPQDGRIDIWAGTYDGGYCDSVLSLETFPR